MAYAIYGQADPIQNYLLNQPGINTPQSGSATTPAGPAANTAVQPNGQPTQWATTGASTPVASPTTPGQAIAGAGTTVGTAANPIPVATATLNDLNQYFPGGKAAGGMTSQQMVDQLNQQYGYANKPGGLMLYPGKGVNGTDIIAIPGGQYYTIDASGQWGINAGDSGGGSGTGGGGGTTTSPAPSAFVPTAAPAIPTASALSTGTAASPQADSLFNLLMSRATQSENVSPNDPTIAGPTAAYAATDTNNAKNYLAQQAEQGGANSNQTAVARSASEKVGQDVSGFQATQMSNELAARRQEIESALSGASGILTSEQQMALQEELAKIGLQQQQYQFGQSQAQNESQFAQTLAQTAFSTDTSNSLRAAGL